MGVRFAVRLGCGLAVSILFPPAWARAALAREPEAVTARGIGASTAAEILPVALGSSPDCTSSDGMALGDGAGTYGLFVAAFGYECTPSYNQPLLWTEATGMIRFSPPSPATNSLARGVSDEGVVVGETVGDVAVAWVRSPEEEAKELPALDGTMYGSATAISAAGGFIAGVNSTDSTWDVVLWERVGETWSVRSLSSGSGAWPRAVSDAGAVVGYSGWLGGGKASQALILEAGEDPLFLPGARTRAHGISRDGSRVVGAQWRACSPPCEFYPVPVFWAHAPDGGWTMHDLEALDGVDSEALGVAEVDGRTVIVGRGFTRSDAILRAVAWIPEADGSYGPPLRLAAIGGKPKAWATAANVNSQGMVVGTSALTGNSRNAVLWLLPRPALVFVDGFEAGDLCGWSAAVGPGSCG